MIYIELSGRVGDDCYSAWVAWNRLPDSVNYEGSIYYKAPLDVARDGFCAIYRLRRPAPCLLY